MAIKIFGEKKHRLADKLKRLLEDSNWELVSDEIEYFIKLKFQIMTRRFFSECIADVDIEDESIIVWVNKQNFRNVKKLFEKFDDEKLNIVINLK